MPTETKISSWSIFSYFLRLGLTSFGGPIAHLGFFRDEFVRKRKWLTDESFTEIVAFCQFLPGPTSSQVGMILGFTQNRYLGMISAWLGFTLPSALFLIFVSSSYSLNTQLIPSIAIDGLKIVVVAVVAQAVWSMAKSICTNTFKILLMAFTACFVLIFSSFSLVGIVSIFLAGLLGFFFLNEKNDGHINAWPIEIEQKISFLCLFLFFCILFVLPFAQYFFSNQLVAMFNTFYRAGSLVFGGGHVVLPILQNEVIPRGWVTNETFLAGYALTQALPGPLFNFAAFVGSSAREAPHGLTGGLLCLVAIFLPSFLLVLGVSPFWGLLRNNSAAQSTLKGINASVVGILLAALYQPIWVSAIHRPLDFSFSLIAFISLVFLKVPPWLVVLSTSVLYCFVQIFNLI